MRNPHKASRVNKGPDADDRFTPRYLIEALHQEFKFTVDAAGHRNSPATNIIHLYWGGLKAGGMDGLQQSWRRDRVWVNPPFSDIQAWVEKANAEMQAGCKLVVMLMPWNRQEQPFWQRYIEPFRDGKIYLGGLATIITRALSPRVRYGNPKDPEGKKAGSPNFPSGLVIWRANN
jgi:hypothetical protein